MLAPTRQPRDQRSFLLQRAQPAMTGLIDGSLSTLAPVFAVALATHQPHEAFVAGLATAIGAGVSMAFSEGLSDPGDLTGLTRTARSPASARSSAASCTRCRSSSRSFGPRCCSRSR
jgi:hypothetical protein